MDCCLGMSLTKFPNLLSDHPVRFKKTEWRVVNLLITQKAVWQDALDSFTQKWCLQTASEVRTAWWESGVCTVKIGKQKGKSNTSEEWLYRWSQWTIFMMLLNRPGNMEGLRTETPIDLKTLYVDMLPIVLHTSPLKCDWFHPSDSRRQLVLPALKSWWESLIIYVAAHVPNVAEFGVLFISKTDRSDLLVTPLKVVAQIKPFRQGEMCLIVITCIVALNVVL